MAVDHNGEKIPLVERPFNFIGWLAANHAWKTIAVTLVLVGGCCAGFPFLKSENRPEKQWVPSGSPALEHKDYVDAAWPSTNRFGFWIAKCKSPPCNLLEPQYIQRMYAKQKAIMDIVVDGDALYEDKQWKGNVDTAVWAAAQGGKWSFAGSNTTKAKCFKAGLSCLTKSPLDLFLTDEKIINSLTQEQVNRAVNTWPNLSKGCPVTITTADSPCNAPQNWVGSAGTYDCWEFDTTSKQSNCRAAVKAYCDSVCPTTSCSGFDPACNPQAVNPAACQDSGCITAQTFAAFSSTPYDLKDVLKMQGTGDAIQGDATFDLLSIASTPILVGGSEVDPVADAWEKEALCVLGVPVESYTAEDCPEDSLIEFVPNFQRSLGDEFGNAVKGDVAGVGISYLVIAVYLFIMLSRFDTVHSMMGMSIVTLMIVGMSFIGCQGLGFYFGLYNNQLNGNIPFLLLGLGVDDAFVITGELFLALQEHPFNTLEENIMLTARHAGVSILITSATDALAFLVGSSTRLPALMWFCQFAGIGVILCFLLQLFFFFPCLAINARRARANRYDLLCCVKSKTERSMTDELGCCGCCRCKSGVLPMLLKKAGTLITHKIGTSVLTICFATLWTFGIIGCTKIYKDFNLQWFFPDDSYLNTFVDDNTQYFGTGVGVTIYLRDLNYFEAQQNLASLHGTVVSGTWEYLDATQPFNDWHYSFLNATGLPAEFNDIRKNLTVADYPSAYTTEATYYKALYYWYSSGAGASSRSNIDWVDSKCDDMINGCDPLKGLQATRLSVTLKQSYTNEGVVRYSTMDDMRKQVAAIMTKDDLPKGDTSFPFARDFLFWEEVGVIDKELLTNLLISGGCIILMVAIMIPIPRVAVWVCLSIILSVLNLVGFMYWWDVTISGVSTIYILISVGLTVDYSAHIAHCFVICRGTSRERAINALERIGPSVFNAVTSTMLAVIVISTSKSYVFRIFFKSLFLTVILGGLHGLVFLPMTLGLFGGDKVDEKATEKSDAPAKELASSTNSQDGQQQTQNLPVKTHGVKMEDA